MGEWFDQFVAVFGREIRTLRRTRLVWVFALGFFGVVFGTGFVNGAGGYVPLSVSLMTPLELLVPVLVAGLGYRAVLADRERGEIDVLRTYPIAPETFVGGVYLGRLAVVLCIVFGTLLCTGILVPLFGPAPASSQRITWLSSVSQYVQFVVFTGLFVAVVSAVVVLLSATVRNARQGLVVTIIVMSTIAIGLDLAIVLGVAEGLIVGESLPWYLAFSPGSAYRGLVMAFVVAPAVTGTVPLSVPVLSFASLFLWGLLSVTTAAWRVWESVEQ